MLPSALASLPPSMTGRPASLSSVEASSPGSGGHTGSPQSVATIGISLPGLPVDEPEMGPELLPLNPLLADPPPNPPLELLDPPPQLNPISAPQRIAATRIASMRQPAVALTLAIAAVYRARRTDRKRALAEDEGRAAERLRRGETPDHARQA
jgi:hypothetical protein